MKEAIDQKEERAIRIIRTLKKATKNMPQPASSSIVERYGKDPFLVLISCILSLRAKDTASLPISIELFKYAKTPEAMVALPMQQLERIIYSVGYYRSKAEQIKSISNELITRFDGRVPDSYDELISIKGVGPKTANLVLGVAFDIPALIVDIHVHRISNRLGLVKTKTPKETQEALEALLPKTYWLEYSRLLVVWGQNVCVPISPFCSQCPLFNDCKRVGVKRSR